TPPMGLNEAAGRRDASLMNPLFAKAALGRVGLATLGARARPRRPGVERFAFQNSSSPGLHVPGVELFALTC
ncbi:MAG TPA: hypothetical protein VLI91_06780, partial [Roseiarcus sp.]|nr:hypothetical protein [Roseiarcus sp.]